MSVVVTVRFQWRRDTAAAWTAADPVLLDGETGYETDTKKFKIGDGVTAWTALPYPTNPVVWGAIGGALSAQTDLQAALAAKANASAASGSFTTADGKTVTVANGIITSIAT